MVRAMQGFKSRGAQSSLCKRPVQDNVSPANSRLAGATALSLPNLITLDRILMVPVMVWAIAAEQMTLAFVLFLVAGISDGVDGFLAKRFGKATEVRAY